MKSFLDILRALRLVQDDSRTVRQFLTELFLIACGRGSARGRASPPQLHENPIVLVITGVELLHVKQNSIHQEDSAHGELGSVSNELILGLDTLPTVRLILDDIDVLTVDIDVAV